MWSPPRTVSTALMRSWGNRSDTFVCDEPLYAYYLKATGKPHPMAEEIITQHEDDWRAVVAWLTGPIPEGRSIFYHKQMAHHMLPEIERGWLDGVTNCFLIRDPREMLPSYVKKNGLPRLEDTGYPQMLEIFRQVGSASAATPPVVDARDLLDNPRKMLGRLCDALEAPFEEAMLAWPAGLRKTDGVWAEHWYPEVQHTTSFGPYIPKSEPVHESLDEVLKRCNDAYQELFEHRLR